MLRTTAPQHLVTDAHATVAVVTSSGGPALSRALGLLMLLSIGVLGLPMALITVTLGLFVVLIILTLGLLVVLMIVTLGLLMALITVTLGLLMALTTGTLGGRAVGVARGDLEFGVADTGYGAVSRAGTASLEDWDAASGTFEEVVAVLDVRPGLSWVASRKSRDSGEEERGREGGQSLEGIVHLDTGWN